ncbi:MAG: LysR family transcriptional regulator, partial [Bacteroidetes bacterium]
MRRNQLEYILAVAQYQSFSKAAQVCFVTQSTLSALVAKYEQEIDITLFDRKTKPITVTPQGEKVLRHLRSIKREFQLLDEAVNQIKGYEAGNLRIACIPTVAPYLFPLILNRLSAAYPKVNFTIHEITTERVIEDLLAGNIDIGIVSTPLDRQELTEFPLYYEDFLLYDCGLRTKPRTYRISDIDLDRLWLLEEGHCLRN